MRYENKFWERKGNYFYNSKEAFDLSSVRFLHTGIDTVKQLYNCLIKPDVLLEIERYYDSPTGTIKLGDCIWTMNKSGKQAGYQYILKNLDLGLVVLLKSFYCDASLNGSHLKIEVTPQRIHESTPEQLKDDLNAVAGIFATQLVESGVACHIAVDVKGLEIPKDFESRLVAKAKRQFRFNNISQAQWSLNEASVIYGNGQSYTFGSAGALQFCLYEKDQEAIKSDKLSFWQSVWETVPSVEDFMTPEYQDGDRVHRLEMRFHHSVVREFCYGSVNEKTGEALQINNVHDLSQHLTSLWKYALNNFRLQHSSSYIDPFWQMLIDDIVIYPPAPHWFYKRAKKQPGQSTRRNVAYWLGNVLKLMARKRFTVAHACQWILASGCTEELADYFGVFQFGANEELEFMLREFVQDRLEMHVLNGVAA